MSRDNLIKIFNDTIDKIENEYSWMLDSNNLYYNENYFNDDKIIKKFSNNVNIKLVKQTTVDAIIENSNKVFGILNFASAKNPGGGVLKGSVAQEEALARASSLYPIIKQCAEFYTNVSSAPYYSDRIIYSKPIYVFKDNFGNEIDPMVCEVITCAAPNYSFGSINIGEHKKIMTNRFIKVIKTAIINNQRNLILGAWGCGVFQNPADINAQIFKEVLDYFSSSFDEIIFAIPDDKNYTIFQKYIL